MDYSLWGHKESEATERLTLSLSLSHALAGGLLTKGPPGKSCINFKRGYHMCKVTTEAKNSEH